MKWINGRRIIKEVLDSYQDYDQIPEESADFIERLLASLHYGIKKITANELKHFFEYSPHLFEENILEELKKDA